jgi:Tol biopolymer transport system component
VAYHPLRFLLIAAALVGAPLRAQEAPPTGAQNPPGVQWDRLVSPHFDIIYPRELAAEAQRAARLLEGVSPTVSRTYGLTPPRLALVLQNRGVLNNGYVALAPRRTEWLATAPQVDNFAGPIDWLTLLATHEYRHVVQFSKMKRGFVDFMNDIFGEPGWQFASNLALPPWFWEGDAVVTETALTAGGRGRIPAFNVEHRALTLAKGRPDYWTAYWRSYGRFVPDHYQLGYAITAWLTLSKGPETIDSLVGRAADRSWLPWGLGGAFKDVTGQGVTETYGLAMDSLTAAWKAQVAGLTFTAATPAHVLDTANFSWTEFPQWTADGHLIAFRRGIDILYHFVRLTPGDSTRTGEALFTPAPYQFGVAHSTGGGRLAYAEIVYDARWGQQQWSRVRVRDLATGDSWTVGNAARWFAPALSPDGQRLAVVEQTIDGTVTLVVVDANTGVEQVRLPNERNALVQVPRWAPDGQHLVYARVERATGRSLVLVDLAARTERTIIGPTNVAVTAPVTDGRYLYFVSPRSGTDNIFAADLTDRRTWQVTQRPVSATAPSISPDGRTLAFQEMTGDGQRVVTMPLDSSTWTPLARAPERPLGWAEGLTAKLGPAPVVDTAVGTTYPTAPYSALAHAFNFYGLTVSATPFSPVATATIASRDLLGTTSVGIGARTNSNEGTWGVGVSGTYAAWWPVITASLFRDQRTSTYFRQIDSTHISEFSYNWSEMNAALGVMLPLNLTTGLYTTYLNIGGIINARRTTDQPVNFRIATGERLLRDGTFLPVTWYVSGGRGYATYRDLQPVWGQYATIQYDYTPFTRSVNSGGRLSGRGFLYFPGFVRHHGFMVEGGYERQWAGNYFFSSAMAFPRGYSALSFDKFRKLAVNYAFPIDYPDVRLLGSLQVQRLRGNFFHDYGVGDLLPSSAVPAYPAGTKTQYQYTSSGVELMADTYLWQFPAPIGIGFRTVYTHEEKKLRTSLLLQVNF